MTDYVNSCREAMEAVSKITGSKKVNVSAGCSGGQTAAMLASKMAADEDDLLGALTLMVCVLHPKQNDIEAGSLVSKNGLALARRRASKKGVIKGDDLARGFAWLRPNDLIWNYVINNYLLGQDPPAFDVLFWNADATNLSGALMNDFLTLFETLAFTKQGEVEMVDHKIDLSKVTSDLFILGGVTDHITPWKATYRSTRLFGSDDVTYVLSPFGPYAGDPEPSGQSESEVLRPEGWRCAVARNGRCVAGRYGRSFRLVVAFLDGMATIALGREEEGTGQDRETKASSRWTPHRVSTLWKLAERTGRALRMTAQDSHQT